MAHTLTQTQFKEVLPLHIRKNVSPLLVTEVNKLLTDPELEYCLVDNLISYTSVMREGKFKLTDYVAAVKFVSYKLTGNTDKDAFKKTFPKRFKKYTNNGLSPKEISSYISAYKNNKLVTGIYAQTLVPIHVANAHIMQQAINTQYMIMQDSEVSPKVRSEAANSLMTHLKAPESKKIELDIGITQSNSIDDLRIVMGQFADVQQKAIAQGTSTATDIAHSNILIDHDEE